MGTNGKTNMKLAEKVKNQPTREDVEVYVLLDSRIKELMKHKTALAAKLKTALNPGGDPLEGFSYQVKLSEVPQVSSSLDYRALLVGELGEDDVAAMELEAKSHKLDGTPHLVPGINTSQSSHDKWSREAAYTTFEQVLAGKYVVPVEAPAKKVGKK